MAKTCIVSLGLCLGALLQLEKWNLALLTVIAAVRGPPAPVFVLISLTHLPCQGAGFYGAYLLGGQRLPGAK